MLEENQDLEVHNNRGESPDHHGLTVLQLAHRVIEKFPELAKRYRKFIGTTVVVSSALVVLASLAVSYRLRSGQSPEQILKEITSDEIENAGKKKPKKPESSGKKDRRRFLH